MPRGHGEVSRAPGTRAAQTVVGAVLEWGTRMSAMNDDELGKLLNELETHEASADFTETVLARLDEQPHPSRRGYWLAAAALVVAVVASARLVAARRAPPRARSGSSGNASNRCRRSTAPSSVELRTSCGCSLTKPVRARARRHRGRRFRFRSDATRGGARPSPRSADSSFSVGLQNAQR